MTAKTSRVSDGNAIILLGIISITIIFSIFMVMTAIVDISTHNDTVYCNTVFVNEDNVLVLRNCSKDKQKDSLMVIIKEKE